MSNKLVINSKEDWVVLREQCKEFITSGLLPDHVWKGVSTAQAVSRAITIATKGRELGIPPMQAFGSISVVQGKPCLSAELMVALVYQRVPGAQINFLTPPKEQHLRCEAEFIRPNGKPQLFGFSIEDAQKAGLMGKPTWKQYPSAMLRARCVSAGCRAVFPDAIMGCYTAEELGGQVLEGEIVEGSATLAAPDIEQEKTSTNAPPPPEGGNPQETPRGSNTSQPSAKQEARRPPPTTGKISWREKAATDPQCGRITTLSKKLGLSDEQRHQMLEKLFNVKSSKDLTQGEASDLINDLQKKISENERGNRG